MPGNENTIFGKIIRKEVPAEIVYETSTVLAFKDINPQAPVHILIVPKKTLENVSEVETCDRELLGDMILAARDIARQERLTEGFRLVINEGPQGGQSVAHLHVHLMGGRYFDWPPG